MKVSVLRNSVPYPHIRVSSNFIGSLQCSKPSVISTPTYVNGVHICVVGDQTSTMIYRIFKQTFYVQQLILREGLN